VDDHKQSERNEADSLNLFTLCIYTSLVTVPGKQLDALWFQLPTELL